MTRLVSISIGSDRSLPSPDGRYHALLLSRGLVDRDAIEYRLEVYASDGLQRGPGAAGPISPVATARLVSTTNDAAIRDVRWLNSDEITFVGVEETGPSQAYLFDVRTSRLTQLTHSNQGVLALGASPKKTVFFAAMPAEPETASSLVVETGNAFVLTGAARSFPTEFELIETLRGGKSQRSVRKNIHFPYFLDSWIEVSPSPSGRTAVVTMPVADVPDEWSRFASRGPLSLKSRYALQYELVELSSGRTRPLVAAPIGVFNWPVPPSALWTPDEDRVILANILAETSGRLSTQIVEVSLGDQSVRVIAETTPVIDEKGAIRNAFARLRWIVPGEILEVGRRIGPGDIRASRYRKIGSEWVHDRDGNNPNARVVVLESPSTPPQLSLTSADGATTALLRDLNPQLAEVELGPVEAVSWTDEAGVLSEGTLALPPGHVAGRRYPLVIQLRDHQPTRFLADGPFTTAHAARALAANGIAVLQFRAVDNEKAQGELELHRRAVEGAIAHVAKLGYVDTNRIGLVGFSRSCWAVKHFLVTSKVRIAAAIVADGVDGGYFQYLLRNDPVIQEDFELHYGARPFGAGLQAWIRQAPAFKAHLVQTPLRLEAIGTVLGEWEMYAALKALGKPVDLIYYPHGAHQLVRPSEVVASQQGSVDWFRFWLKDEEDADPAKAAQYVRWRKLRALRDSKPR